MNNIVTSEMTANTVIVPEKPVTMLKRIGSTTYSISVNFSKTNKETVQDKILRLIKNDIYAASEYKSKN